MDGDLERTFDIPENIVKIEVDETDSNRGRNQGLILSSLAIVLMLLMMPIQENLDDSMEMYGQYLSEYGTDTYEMIALLSENDLTFEQ